MKKTSFHQELDSAVESAVEKTEVLMPDEPSKAKKANAYDIAYNFISGLVAAFWPEWSAILHRIKGIIDFLIEQWVAVKHALGEFKHRKKAAAHA